jgi:hypothetical protein
LWGTSFTKNGLDRRSEGVGPHKVSTIQWQRESFDAAFFIVACSTHEDVGACVSQFRDRVVVYIEGGTGVQGSEEGARVERVARFEGSVEVLKTGEEFGSDGPVEVEASRGRAALAGCAY